VNLNWIMLKEHINALRRHYKPARQCTYNVTLRRVRATIVTVESIKYCVFWACNCSLSYPASKVHAPYYIFVRGRSGCKTFLVLSLKWHDFRNKKLRKVKCVYNFFLKHVLFQEEFSDVHVKYPLFLSDFNETWIFPIYFSKSTQISNSMKICLVGVELFHGNGRIDGETYDDAKSRFSQFCRRASKPISKVCVGKQ